MARQELFDETGNCSSGAIRKRQISSMMNSVKWKGEAHEEEGGCDHIGTIPQDGRAIVRGGGGGVN